MKNLRFLMAILLVSVGMVRAEVSVATENAIVAANHAKQVEHTKKLIQQAKNPAVRAILEKQLQKLQEVLSRHQQAAANLEQAPVLTREQADAYLADNRDYAVEHLNKTIAAAEQQVATARAQGNQNVAEIFQKQVDAHKAILQKHLATSASNAGDIAVGIQDASPDLGGQLAQKYRSFIG